MKKLSCDFQFNPPPAPETPPATEGDERKRLALFRLYAQEIMQSDLSRKERLKKLKELQQAM